jgi:protoporphyrinogen oxidase
MNPFFIVGGGIAGLLSARLLKHKGLPFLGFEKSDALGGRTTFGHHRLYSTSAVRFLSSQLESLEWEEIDDKPQLRKKGEWVEWAEEASEQESFYLHAPFFHPHSTFPELIHRLSSEVAESFQMRKTVTAIYPDTHRVEFLDGSALLYEKLIWCSSLPLLNKVWQGDKLPLYKLLKKAEEPLGGISVDVELSSPLFSFRNTVVFPFRFKDSRLKALGMRSSWPIPPQEKSLTHWLLFLEKELAEDREEIAKCVRTFHRELEKEFPALKENLRTERIVYLPSISGEKPVAAKTLNVLPDLYYVGPEITLGDKQDTARNLDLTLSNCQQLYTALEGSGESLAEEPIPAQN